MVVGTINKENEKYSSRPENVKKRVLRNKARAIMMKAGKARKGDGKDVGHKLSLSKGGSNSRSNLRMEDPGKNRSFRRSKSSKMISERSKKGR